MWSRFSSTCTSCRRPILGISERETGEGRPRAPADDRNPKHQISWSERPRIGHRAALGRRPSDCPAAELASRACRTRRRPMHDADSHIMEPADWLHPYLDAGHPGALPARVERRQRGHDAARRGRRARPPCTTIPRTAPRTRPQITLRKNFLATGSFLNDDRAAALDLLGFASQLVFDTFTSPHALRFDRDGDHELAVTIARAQHRAVLDWCSVDPRLLPVTVVPVGDIAAAVALTTRRDRRGQRRDLDRAVPGRAIRRATSRSSRCGPRARKRACRSCCTSRARART